MNCCAFWINKGSLTIFQLLFLKIFLFVCLFTFRIVKLRNKKYLQNFYFRFFVLNSVGTETCVKHTNFMISTVFELRTTAIGNFKILPDEKKTPHKMLTCLFFSTEHKDFRLFA